MTEMDDMELVGAFTAFLEFLKTGNEEHKHKCPSCNFVWDHNPNDMQDDELYARGHRCVKCGTEQREKYFGPDSSKCLNNGARIQYRP